MATGTWRAALERWLLTLWFGGRHVGAAGRLAARCPGPLLRLLARLVARVAVRRRRRIDRRPDRTRPAVVVIGNLVVGGAGKTPVTIALAQALHARGFVPGVLARGYRASTDAARMVDPGQSAEQAGDEPLLVARATGCPVAVAADRAAALELLRARAPQVDVAIADDGLQHVALPRDVEVAVFDARGAGNGEVLPAGPLREPLSTLDALDAVLLNGTDRPPAPHARVFRSRLAPIGFRPVARAEPQPAGSVAAWPVQAGLVSTQAFAERCRSARVVAVAGLGAPERFFATLRTLGIECVDAVALPDHAPLTAARLTALRADLVLMTEKDAVKCEAHADARCWALVVHAELDAAFVEFVAHRLSDR